jgi:hypothetical protein
LTLQCRSKIIISSILITIRGMLVGIFFDSAGQRYLSLVAPIFGTGANLPCFLLNSQEVNQIDNYSKKHLILLSAILIYSLILWIIQPDQNIYVIMILIGSLACAGSAGKYFPILIKPQSLKMAILTSRESCISRKIYILMGGYLISFVFFIWQIMTYCYNTQLKIFFFIAPFGYIICSVLALYCFLRAILWR